MNKQKGLAPILIILLIAAAAISGYLFYTNYSNNRYKTTSIQQLVQPSPSPVISPVASGSAETVNWRAYSNIDGKYSIKYPSEWNVVTGGNLAGSESAPFGPGVQYVTEDSNTKFIIEIQRARQDTGIINAKTYADAYVASYRTAPGFTDLNVATIKIEGLDAIRVSFAMPTYGYRTVHVIFDKNGIIYSMAYNDTKPFDDEELKTFDQILSTFRFD